MPARTDKTTDPALRAQLLLARRGQAFFSRALNELRNDELDAPSLVPGWTRRHVAAHVGLNARALTRLTDWAATGVETPMYASPEQRDEEIAFAATLPARALRNLSAHAAVHLDVEWRDLEPAAWDAQVRTALGRLVPARETVWMRTREVWVHAVDLDHGASFRQFPPELVDALLADVVGAWRRRQAAEPVPAMVLEPTDRPGGAALRVGGADAVPVHVLGRAADLAQWGTGRGAHGVTQADGSPPPRPPRWL